MNQPTYLRQTLQPFRHRQASPRAAALRAQTSWWDWVQQVVNALDRICCERSSEHPRSASRLIVSEHDQPYSGNQSKNAR
jgi:hypothetical protein